MTKKIPGSSLKLVIISLHLLFLACLVLGPFLYNYGFVVPKPGQIPWKVNKFGIIPILFMFLANITVLFIVIADILALKRERPRMSKKVLLIISLVFFSLFALFSILSLLSYIALVIPK